MERKIEDFKSFWVFYVSEHLHPTNRALHFVGTGLAIGFILTAVGTGVYLWLLAAPVTGYAFAWFGHFVFEKNRPATFTYPLWSLAGDYVMFFMTLFGRMAPELERARKAYGKDLPHPERP
jgi:hypothetical protein